MKFRIEYLAKQERPCYVFARQLESGDFLLTPSSRLGGVPIRQQVSSPKALTPHGETDRMVFAFVLVTASDLPKLTIGQVVELETNDA